MCVYVTVNYIKYKYIKLPVILYIYIVSKFTVTYTLDTMPS